MKIAFELSDEDLRYFRSCLQKVRQGRKATKEDIVLREARELMDEVRQAEAPEFVQNRFRRLEMLVEMLEDDEWRLVSTDRARVLNALAYFVDPDDLIPDRTPGIGYLDDAIMVELVVQELRHEIEAYEKFCEFREKRSEPTPDQIEARRVALQQRMRRNRRRERESRRARKPGRSPLGLW